MKTQLAIVTSNAMKFAGHQGSWGDDFEVEQVPLELLEIQGTAEEIIVYKAKQAWKELQRPLVVDDGSLEIEMLGGFPGPYIKHMLRAMGAKGISGLCLGSKVKVYCVLAFTTDGENILISKASLEGTVVEPRVLHDMLFNSFFLPDGYDKTLAEMTEEEKSKFSHRSKAIADLKSQLERL